MKMPKPISNFVVIKPKEPKDKTISGIIMPESYRPRAIQGYVIEKGPGKISKKGIRKPISIEIGQEVVYQRFTGTEFKIGDEKYVIVEEDFVMGVIERDA